MRTEETEFGRRVAEPACVSEAMTRYQKSTWIAGGVAQVVWISGCLETSEIDRAFCAEVPSTDQVGPSVMWRRKKKAMRPSRIEQPRIAQTYTPPPVPPRTSNIVEKPLIQISTPAPVAEQVYATRPANAYRMAKKLAIMQGFKEAKCGGKP